VTQDLGRALPVDSLRDAIPQLRRPFTPEAIRFKVQTVFKGNSGCLVVAYIDARLVSDRLNSVCPDAWSAAYDRIDGSPKLMICRLRVFDVIRQDVGESPKGLSKDLFSDSLKRAAVHFGVGVSVYALPQITLLMRDSRGRLEERPSKNGPTLVLTEKGHAGLRGGYKKWLDEHGRARFGEELDHGDVEGQVVDPEAEAGDGFAPEPPAAVDDERGQELIDSARALYGEISALGDGAGRRLIPPGTFNGWLTGAQHSHAELERLIAHLESRRSEIAAEHEAVIA
jgi:hypothetical protein